MKAPDIIYTDGRNTCASAPVFSNIDGNVKYIRVDLAGLTWEDVQILCDCFMDAGLHSELPARSKGFYQEVLRRFMEKRVNTTRKL